MDFAVFDDILICTGSCSRSTITPLCQPGHMDSQHVADVATTRLCIGCGGFREVCETSSLIGHLTSRKPRAGLKHATCIQTVRMLWPSSVAPNLQMYSREPPNTFFDCSIACLPHVLACPSNLWSRLLGPWLLVASLHVLPSQVMPAPAAALCVGQFTSFTVIAACHVLYISVASAWSAMCMGL
jgi:ferredoxin